MTSGGLESFVILITASALVIILVLVGVPALARLLFRYRLETVRDECMDAVLDGRLRRDASVERFITSVERLAKRSRVLTLPRAMAMYMALLKLGVADSAGPDSASYCDLEANERRIMHAFEARRQAALWSHLTWGSPMGWAMAPLLMIMARRASPAGELAKPKDALPELTREAVLCHEQGTDPATNQWMCATYSRHLTARG